ncbi:MAG: Gfo/Idh/MocA family oxidoreductase [Lachnospiraceae bacterium]|nr:Gfo/Idh/MocA family oxidoreductase [Lachnospiraceae bacterium]
MVNKVIRIGILGCGRVAHNHALSISRCPSAVLVAAAGGRKAQEFGQKYNIPIFSVEDILKNPDVDAILVLTPPESHQTYTMMALDYGKHVLVEKPVSFDAIEIANMRRKAEEMKLVCMPGHSYLYMPELSRMAQVVPSGGIGLPTYLYLTETYYMPPALFERYQGPAYDVLCHQLYLSLAFLGTPCLLSAFQTEFPKEQIPTGGPQVAVTLQYPSGAIAQITVSWAVDDCTSDPFGFKVKVLGNAGGMHFSRLDYVRQEEGNVIHMGYQEMFDKQLEWFVNRCIIDGVPPLSNMQDAEIVCRLQKSILESICKKQILTFH